MSDEEFRTMLRKKYDGRCRKAKKPKYKTFDKKITLLLDPVLDDTLRDFCRVKRVKLSPLIRQILKAYFKQIKFPPGEYK